MTTDRTAQGQRIDKWLWFARLAKTRALAQTLAESGRIRLTVPGRAANRITRASQLVRPGDVLTIPLGERIYIVRVCAAGVRRGPAVEARTLYVDESPQSAMSARKVPALDTGTRRPDKKDRRALRRLREGAA